MKGTIKRKLFYGIELKDQKYYRFYFNGSDLTLWYENSKFYMLNYSLIHGKFHWAETFLIPTNKDLIECVVELPYTKEEFYEWFKKENTPKPTGFGIK